MVYVAPIAYPSKQKQLSFDTNAELGIQQMGFGYDGMAPAVESRKANHWDTIPWFGSANKSSKPRSFVSIIWYNTGCQLKQTKALCFSTMV